MRTAHWTASARRRVLAVTTALAATAALGACGFNAQTLQPYNQADGVNLTIGSDSPIGAGVKARNVAIILNTATGDGVLSGLLVSGQADTLSAVTALANTEDGMPGPALRTVVPNGGLRIPAQKAVVLTDDQSVRVSGEGLKPGLTAQVQLTFATAGVGVTTVPVIDSQFADYNRYAPSPAASASPASPSASPTR